MNSVSLSAFPRTQVRRSQVKKLRTSGRVPAVIYGGKSQPQPLEINLKDLENLVHHSVSENILVDLAVTGDSRPKRLALVQEIQHHPLTGKMLHVDLHEVAENEKVTLMVPLETIGEPVGVKSGGGVLEHVVFKIKVRALPKDLPAVVTVDVTSLELGKSLHLGEIAAPANVEILGDKHIPVIAVALPKTEAEETAEAAAAAPGAGEVEMIKEKKEDGAPADAKADAKGGDKAAAADKGGDKKPAEKKK